MNVFLLIDFAIYEINAAKWYRDSRIRMQIMFDV